MALRELAQEALVWVRPPTADLWHRIKARVPARGRTAVTVCGLAFVVDGRCQFDNRVPSRSTCVECARAELRPN